MTEARFLPQAVREYAEAVGWYSDIDPELAQRFVERVEERLDLAIRAPGAGRLEPSAPARFALRWYGLSHFPYALLISSFGEAPLVVAVAHERRRPGYWSTRLDALDTESG